MLDPKHQNALIQGVLKLEKWKLEKIIDAFYHSQCLQWENPSSLLEVHKASIEDSATSSTLLLGCPNLWCHNNQLLPLFTWKTEGEWVKVEEWFNCEGDSELM